MNIGISIILNVNTAIKLKITFNSIIAPPKAFNNIYYSLSPSYYHGEG